MLNQIAVWVMDVALILFAVFKVNRGVNKRPSRSYDQLLFNSYQFTLYYSKGSLFGQLFFWLIFSAVFVLINYSAFNAFLLLSVPLIFWHFFLTIRRFLWKFEVDGHSAFIRTGLIKRHFLLTDVTEMAATNARFLGIDSGFISHINLYNGRRRLAKVPAHVMNYQSLLNVLMQISTSGVEDLIDEFNQPVTHMATSKPTWLERKWRQWLTQNQLSQDVSQDGLKFAFLFLITFFVAAFLLLGPIFLDGLISRNAYSAREVLIGFVIWLSIWTLGIFASRTVFLEGGLFLIQVRKQKGRNIILPMIFLLLTVFVTRLGMDVVLFHMDNAHFNDIGAAVADLRAIEADELEERVLNISLDSANERMRSLSPDGEFEVVYRMWFSADWQLYFNFPREHRPADLRAQMIENELEIGFRAVNRGQIRVKYTPNMHMITAVEFVEPIALAEIPPPVWHQDEFFLLNIEQNIRYPRVAMEEFLRTSPHMDEAMVNHYLTLFTNNVADYIEREVFTEDWFSFIEMESNQVILDFQVPADESGAYYQPVRATVIFEWDDPVAFQMENEEENQAAVLEHLAREQQGREFRAVTPIYAGDSSMPFAFYDINNPDDVIWLWLHVTGAGELRVWASEWNRE